MSAPDRIWAFVGGANQRTQLWLGTSPPHPGMCSETEYVREDLLAATQAEILRLTRERDEALRLADWSAVENNTVVNQVWELLGGPDATREGGQSLVNRVKEALAARSLSQDGEGK